MRPASPILASFSAARHFALRFRTPVKIGSFVFLCLLLMLSFKTPATTAASNPYPLCNGANCTWYAWQVWHDWGEDMPVFGNANEWATNAAASGKYKVGKNPAVRAIMVLSDYCDGCIRPVNIDSLRSVFGDGHVAVVINVQGDIITTHDQAWCTGESAPYRERQFSLSQLRAVQPDLSFIYFPDKGNKPGQGADKPDIFTNEYNTFGPGFAGQPKDVVKRAGTGWIQPFTGGDGQDSALMLLDGMNRAFYVHTGIWQSYFNFGLSNSKLGFPTSEEKGATPSPYGTKGVYQNFEHGTIHWYNNNGYFTINAIQGIYTGLNGSGSRLGFPTSNEYAIANGWRSDFEGGYIEYHNDSTSKVVYTRK